MSTEARALDDVIDDGWEDVTKPYSVPALVAALLEDHEASEIPESRRQLAACELPRAEARVVGVQR